ncbi:MAG: 3-dehydroquinate synthase [Proteobacteria bacterium]|nr:3-dehydroquinate synthase [Pseudomonadota bacterium]
MQTLNVNLNVTYPIHIGPGLLDHEALFAPYLTDRAVIVTNTKVAPLYLKQLSATLKRLHIQCVPVILPDGEAYKTAETLNNIYTQLLENHIERKTAILALGGGVVGDMAGYAAATYLRGIPFIQIPTTLLAQVDSSVGGKTGINHALGKNMIGAFYQPLAVIADTNTLNTLNDRELSAGLAEVIKYGLIRDLPFFEWLENNLDQLLSRSPNELIYAIRRSCENKVKVVSEDEKEKSIRAILNLGHTFGHAIENGMGYGTWLHGEAVAAGTILAAELSKFMGWLNDNDINRITRLFQRAELPIIAPALGVSRYLDLMSLDKKVENGKIRFILLKNLGQAIIVDNVAQHLVESVLETYTR